MIVCVDSNDWSGAAKHLKISLRPALDLENKGAPKSCCDDSGYTYVGDYILDTQLNTETKIVDIPSNAEPDLMSDHKPIYLHYK